ncbi:MAG: 5-formyltetrahydrofolate cyclo-ligase [Phycisphaerales bacterium JB065]
MAGRYRVSDLMRADMDAAKDKATLRVQIRARLRALDGSEVSAASDRVCSLLSDRLRPGIDDHDGPILSFAPIRRTDSDGGAITEEVDLTSLHHTLIGRGMLALPRIDWENRTMQAWRLAAAPLLEASEHLVVHRHGVPEPRDGEVVDATELRAVLVPGLAFDRSGARLGRGAGFYDRYLEAIGSQTRVIGVCFEAQVVERVPTEAHDRCVDALVTERGWIECGSSAADEV